MHECVSLYQEIGGTGNFFQQGLLLLENDKNWFSFVFTLLPKHILRDALYKNLRSRNGKQLSIISLWFKGAAISSVFKGLFIFFNSLFLQYCGTSYKNNYADIKFGLCSRGIAEQL